jgi:acetylornithine deacetylase/succinyl-diaminopimelate desuccinylase-like protein
MREALAAAVAAEFEGEVAFLSELVRSRSEIPPGDSTAISELVARHLEGLGFEVDRHPVPEPFARQHGLRAVVNLLVRRTYGEGATVALQCHGDVVPAGSGWSVDPFGGAVRRDAIWGRGAAVSKACIACFAYALKALEASGVPLAGAAELHVTFDEEAGGHVGPQWLIAQGLTRPDLVVASGFTHSITTVHAGCLHMEVVVRGRPAHAAMPEEGADALEAATPVLAALYAEQARLAGLPATDAAIGRPKLTIGTIQGGISVNVVPDRVVFRIDRRITPAEDGEAVEAALARLIEDAMPPRAGVELECRRLMLAEPLRPLPGVERLVGALQAAALDVLPLPLAAGGSALFSDGRHYAAAGIPTVLYGAGPRSVAEAHAYGPDERLKLSDLKAATEVVAGALARLLGR